MKKKTERSLIGLLVMIFMLLPAFSAAETPLPVSLLTGEAPETLNLVLSEPEVRKLSAFDENRTEQINRLIRHLAADLRIDNPNSQVSILVDGEEAFSFLRHTEADRTKRIYSFDPGTIYPERTESEETNPDDFSVFLEDYVIGAGRYLDDFYTLFARAPEAFSERMRTEGTELRFSGFGKAVQRMTISFPADYVAENFPAALANLTDSAECKAFLNGLTFSGNQRIGILNDAEGNMVRINYDGMVGESAEKLRKVQLVWKALRQENHQKDGITLKTPSVTGADKDNIALERDLETSDEKTGSYTWDLQIDHKAGKEDKKQTHFTARLTETDGVISGGIEYGFKRDGKNPKIRITPELRETNRGEFGGSIEIADYSGKIELNRVILNVLIRKGEEVAWPGNEQARTPATATDIAAQNEPEETLAGILIQKLFGLPEEDLAYFSNEIPAELWQELFQ